MLCLRMLHIESFNFESKLASFIPIRIELHDHIPYSINENIKLNRMLTLSKIEMFPNFCNISTLSNTELQISE